MVFTPTDGSEPTRQLVHEFKGKSSAGCFLGMFNTDESIRSFAKSCLGYALNR
jgi:isocitrate dehydrogenase